MEKEITALLLAIVDHLLYPYELSSDNSKRKHMIACATTLRDKASK